MCGIDFWLFFSASQNGVADDEDSGILPVTIMHAENEDCVVRIRLFLPSKAGTAPTVFSIDIFASRHSQLTHSIVSVHCFQMVLRQCNKHHAQKRPELIFQFLSAAPEC